MTRSTDITSFTDHRQNLREHLNRVKKTGRPLYVTTNGETEAVVLSAKAYDELADRADLAETLAMIQRSEADIKAGRARDAREALRGIARKRGLPLER
ncbi:MAG: type II toxin-antitoxin system Phd/YefM family antitoxin [Phycisphaerales bacterium]